MMRSDLWSGACVLSPLQPGHSQASQASLVSAVPRQVMWTLGELLTVPNIKMLLFGYLPMGFMRRSRDPGLGAACGQLLLVERHAYRAAGGHRAIRGLLHDGIQLARLFRRNGYMTDLVAGDRLATCRMYGGFAEAWAGFAKNAREGMATPVGLPIWTMLLLGGHILPFVLLALVPTWPVGLAVFLSLGTRSLITFSSRENPISIPLHPFTILVGLVIQWSVLLGIGTRRRAGWKGRLYPAGWNYGASITPDETTERRELPGRVACAVARPSRSGPGFLPFRTSCG